MSQIVSPRRRRRGAPHHRKWRTDVMTNEPAPTSLFRWRNAFLWERRGVALSQASSGCFPSPAPSVGGKQIWGAFVGALLKIIFLHSAVRCCKVTRDPSLRESIVPGLIPIKIFSHSPQIFSYLLENSCWRELGI